MFRILILIALLLTAETFAHPVAFRGSKGVMGYHSSSMSHTQLNYSFRHWFATGVHNFKKPSGGNAQFASANFLLKRWNGENLQANLYSVMGVGPSELNGPKVNAQLGALQFDIEDRHLYFLAKHLMISSGSRDDLKQSVVRFGFAPYVDAFDGLHSWIIFEWAASKLAGRLKANYEVTPLLRIFYRNLLFEVGQSFKGTTKFNYITHF